MFIFILAGVHAGSHEKRLLHHLLDQYNVLERPVANESDPLQLSFGLTLMQIIDVVSIKCEQSDAGDIKGGSNSSLACNA